MKKTATSWVLQGVAVSCMVELAGIEPASVQGVTVAYV